MNDGTTRSELRFPGFWTVQLTGWTCFYVTVALSALPNLKDPSALRAGTAFTLAAFAMSCLLRPICRYLMRRTLSWVALEVRAAFWSVPAGLVSGYAAALATAGHLPNWVDWLETSLRSAFTLFTWCSFYFSIKLWQNSMLERERLLRVERDARDAKLNALRYQINPHFLFNSLNAVSTLVVEGNRAAATRMLSQIGEFLRAILDVEAAPETPFVQEIAFIEQYLAIEQTRLGERLRVEVDIAPETLDALIPSMLLQPLVENAVRHGVASLVKGGTIRIASSIEGSRLRISVCNSGPVVPQIQAAGIGLNNTVERLQTLYGEDHVFALNWPESGGCEATITIPFRVDAHATSRAPAASNAIGSRGD